MSCSPKFQSLPLLLLVCIHLVPVRAAEPAAPAATEPKPAVQPSATVTGELWDNVSGGLHSGSHWNTLVDLGLTFDLARLGGPANGSFFAQLHWVENRHNSSDFGEHTGTANPVGSIMAADHLRVFNFYYRQEWSDGRFALKLGQLALDDEFMASECACLFAHSALGAMPTQVGTPVSTNHDNNSAFPVYAVAAPGVWISARPSDKLSLQAGLYHGGPGPDTAANHGFHYDSGPGIGPVLFYEGSYHFCLAGRASTLRAGGAVHFGRFDSFAALNAGAESAAVHGIHSFYAVQDLVLLAADADHPKLAAFWRAGLSPQQDRSVVHRYADTGLNWFAPLPCRACDIAGIAISYTEYGSQFRLRDPALAAAETALELTYRAQLTKPFSVQAIVQRHFNPAPRQDDGRRHTATVLGLRAQWTY